MARMGRTTKKISLLGCTFFLHPEVYEPAEDSILLATNQRLEPQSRVLDLGTGCGIQGIIAAKKHSKVVSTDINPFAVELAEKNASLNNVRDMMEFRLGDLFEPVKGEIFDVILFNPPYLPRDPDERVGWLEKAWDGGKSGRSLIDRCIDKAGNHLVVGGHLEIVQSSIADIDKTLERLTRKGFMVEVVAEKKIFFEKLVVMVAVKC